VEKKKDRPSFFTNILIEVKNIIQQNEEKFVSVGF
jgi:hypothetical protein